MSVLHIDIETYSSINLTKCGLHRYCEDVEVTLVGYAVDNAPVDVWDVTAGGMPLALREAFTHSSIFAAHNADFERLVLNSPTTKGFNLTQIVPVHQHWECTMTRAKAHGLPGSLDTLTQIYRLGDKGKDAGGRKLVNLFCKPQKSGSRATRTTCPEHWAQFKEYCRRDVEAERELYKKLPRWNCTEAERELWLLDQIINDRGFAVDVELARAALVAIDIEKKGNDARTQEMTGGAVNSAGQRDAMLRFIKNEYSVDLPDMQMDTIRRRIEDPDLPEAVKELLKLRLQTSGTATAKYGSLLNAVAPDNRLRGTLQYCGASRTGRWSGRIFQPQNLARPTHSQEDIELGIDALKAGAADQNVKDLATSALRGAIIAPEGKKLVVADLAAIEGRVLAWLAGEDWKVKAYAEGNDMYVQTYAQTFGKHPEAVTKAERQLGKVLELALGYGGGVGAFVTFAKVYGINLDGLTAGQYAPWAVREAEAYCKAAKDRRGESKEVFIACDAIKRMWRGANPAIAAFWAEIESKCVRGAQGQDQALRARYCIIDKKGAWVRIQLPSGRFLCYPCAGANDGKLSYKGINQYTRKWERISTYGGKLTENIVQAISRDVLAHGMTGAEKAGYEVVLSVHDELIAEVPDSPEYTADGLSKIMSTVPSWAPGLPLAAAGFESYRYRKD